jgi:Holliday junction DNA helicase RuvA
VTGVICRMTGRVVEVGDESVIIGIDNLCYDVLVPSGAIAGLRDQVGQELTLHTFQYFEGNPAGAHLLPRMVGFLAPADRRLFNLLTRVKGISIRKALRSMSVPAHQLAAAIERGDVLLLTSLPEIGRKTAAQIISDLQGKLRDLLAPSAEPVPAGDLTAAQRIAVGILVSWGDRRADAERWVASAVKSQADLVEPEEIVRVAYRVKNAQGV